MPKKRGKISAWKKRKERRFEMILFGGMKDA